MYNRSKILALAIIALLPFSMLFMFPQTEAISFVVASGSNPNEYGEGIFTVIVEENSTGDWLPLGYSATNGSFQIGSKVLNWSDWANQGVTTDGTYVYTTNATILMKYTKTGIFQTDHDVTSDTGLGAGFGMGGLCYFNNNLYIATHNSDSSNGTILQYDTDLTFIAEYDTPEPTVSDNLAMGGVSYHNGYIWAISDSETDNSNFQITQYDTSINFVQSYEVQGFSIADSWHYQGLDWYGNYILCNIHEGSDPSAIDVYEFTGSTFVGIGRIEQPYYYSDSTYNWLSQDIAIEYDGGSYYIWFASRKTTNAQNEVAKYRLSINQESSSTFNIAVNTDIRLYTRMTVNFTRLGLSYPDDLTLGQNYIRQNMSVSVIDTVVFSQDNLTYAESGYYSEGIVWYSYVVILHNVFTSSGTIYTATITYDIYGW